MDEKRFRELFDSLTDEQKEKAKACKTPEELTAVLGELGVELPEEPRRTLPDTELSDTALDEVSGGGLWDWVCGWFAIDLVDPPKYPCPRCGSWKVRNYDPGSFYLMRVACNDCHFWGCRDGSPD